MNNKLVSLISLLAISLNTYAQEHTVKPVNVIESLSAGSSFEFDRSNISQEGINDLKQFVKSIENIDIEAIIVIGFTDRLGNENYNKNLSLKRAINVKNKLIELGVKEDKIFADGVGSKYSLKKSCNLIDKNKKIECLSDDRRVEIEVIGTSK